MRAWPDCSSRWSRRDDPCGLDADPVSAAFTTDAVDGRVASVKLNRPQTRNAITERAYARTSPLPCGGTRPGRCG